MAVLGGGNCRWGGHQGYLPVLAPLNSLSVGPGWGWWVEKGQELQELQQDAELPAPMPHPPSQEGSDWLCQHSPAAVRDVWHMIFLFFCLTIPCTWWHQLEGRTLSTLHTAGQEEIGSIGNLVGLGPVALLSTLSKPLCFYYFCPPSSKSQPVLPGPALSWLSTKVLAVN